jgi:hypothetical protein
MPRGRGRIVSVALAAALVVVVPEGARATTTGDEPALAVRVELRTCPDVDRIELEKLLAIEFQTLGVQPQSDSERVVVACSGQRASVSLEPRGASSAVELSRTAASAWPRLLALAVSELVIETRARVPATSMAAPPASVAPATVRRAEAAPALTKPRAALVRLFAGARGSWVPHAASSLWGPELGVETNVFLSAVVELRGRASFGSTSTDVARVRWMAEGGSVALRWDAHLGRFTGGLGPGFSLDALQLSPSVKVPGGRGQPVSGPWGGPELDAQGSLTFGSRVLVYARVEAGLLAIPVRGDASDGRRLVEATEGWLAAAVGAGTQF